MLIEMVFGEAVGMLAQPLEVISICMFLEAVNSDFVAFMVSVRV